MNLDEKYMRLALQQAEIAKGQTSPNPMVGCVMVKEERIVGMGAHLRAGTPHAEIHALRMAGTEASNSTMYVTLEPCHHQGRTGPCTEAIVESGVGRVVVGSLDPDEKVSGKGIAFLKNQGIEIVVGVLEEDCQQLNQAYMHHRRTGFPYVTLKMAMTLDGKIATANGDSKWVTNEHSRAYVHQMRHEMDAVLVGINTVLADQPKLTVRYPEMECPHHPLRVIMDSHLRIPIDSPVVDVSKAPTWVFTTHDHDEQHRRELESKGVRVFVTQGHQRVNLQEMLRVLGNQGILSLLVEGGAEIHASFLREHLAQSVVAFIAPKLLGGMDSRPSVGGISPERMADAVELEQIQVQRFGEDLCIKGAIKNVYRNY